MRFRGLLGWLRRPPKMGAEIGWWPRKIFFDFRFNAGSDHGVGSGTAPVRSEDVFEFPLFYDFDRLVSEMKKAHPLTCLSPSLWRHNSRPVLILGPNEPGRMTKTRLPLPLFFFETCFKSNDARLSSRITPLATRLYCPSFGQYWCKRPVSTHLSYHNQAGRAKQRKL